MVERRKIRYDDKSFATRDSFTNFAASLGYGASNLSSGSSYGFNPISRNHTILEWAYRGSWLVKQVVDAVADDMTREQISIESDMAPDDMDQLNQYMEDMLIWQRINETIKWGRLYGGCIAAIMIEGQNPATPLNVRSISKGQFKGLLVLDRWMVWPHLESPVTDLGQDFGLPKYYEVVSDAKAMPHMKIHHSRCIRITGVDLPYWQKIAENMWGLSVIEPLYDRLIAFDSTTQGAAQLVYRAHLRTLKIEKLRELIAFGGPGYQAVQQQIAMIRLMQSNEGLTVLDSTDEFETHQYAFGGLSDVLVQFAQQLSGAAQIPLTRLFGQAPAGLNATGEADIRNYYDGINAQQEARLRRPVGILMDVAHRSLFGRPLPDGFHFTFAPLWQMTDTEKAQIAVNITNAVTKAQEDAIITPVIAMKELRQSSKITGVFSNITDEDIQQAELAPPPIMGMGMPGAPGSPGAAPGQPGQGMPQQGGGAPEHPPEPKPIGGEQEEDDSALKLPPYNKKHVAAMYSHIKPSAIPPTNKQHIAALYRHLTGDTLPDDLDVLAGTDKESAAVWMVEQHDPETQAFQNMKVLLGYPDREAAISAYKTEVTDADQRIAGVTRMNVTTLRQFVQEWASNAPKHLNGGAENV